MSKWRVDSFEVEIRGDSWVKDANGDHSGYRESGTGWIFIPEGVRLTRLDIPKLKGGLYAPRGIPMTDGDFNVSRWTTEDIQDYDEYNAPGAFYTNYVPVSVDYLEE